MTAQHGIGTLVGTAALTSVAFFWRAAWAFVLGYLVSALIQVFVPRARLARYLGAPGWRSVAYATLFGAASSSCSFAALAATRALVRKGAHFVAAVAFMFASTNLVIELAVLIVIFLGWDFLAAELIGGVLLIAFCSVLIQAAYPDAWIVAARGRLERGRDEAEDFDWRARLRSRESWHLVGDRFVAEWEMVWREILVGFTLAGAAAVMVPRAWWAHAFLAGSGLPPAVIAVENALVAPFVAAATFIGSMGNIPLATVLNVNGVLFAGIMGFIYSDLIVPSLIAVNARYYGWRVALYIAAVMYVSVVATALLLGAVFAALHLTPTGGRTVAEIVRFRIDMTFWLNGGFGLLALGLVALAARHRRARGPAPAPPGHLTGIGGRIRRAVAATALVFLGVGLVLRAFAGP